MLFPLFALFIALFPFSEESLAQQRKPFTAKKYQYKIVENCTDKSPEGIGTVLNDANQRGVKNFKLSCNLNMVFSDARTIYTVHSIYMDHLTTIIERDATPMVITVQGKKQQTTKYGLLANTYLQFLKKKHQARATGATVESDFNKIRTGFCAQDNGVISQCTKRIRRASASADARMREEILAYNKASVDLISEDSKDDKRSRESFGVNEEKRNVTVLNDLFLMANPTQTPGTPGDNIVLSDQRSIDELKTDRALGQEGFQFSEVKTAEVKDPEISRRLDIQAGVEIKGDRQDSNLGEQMKTIDESGDLTKLKANYKSDAKNEKKHLEQVSKVQEAQGTGSAGYVITKLEKGSPEFYFFQFIMEDLDEQVRKKRGADPTGKGGLADLTAEQTSVQTSIQKPRNGSPNGGEVLLDKDIQDALKNPDELIDPNLRN